MGRLGTGVGALFVEARGCFAQGLFGRPLEIVGCQDDTAVWRWLVLDGGVGDAEVCDVDSGSSFRLVETRLD